MNENRNTISKLSNIKKEQPFSIPPNYFDDFYPRLHAKLESGENIVPKHQSRIIRLLKPALALAASFVLIFMLVYWPLHSFLPNHVAKSGIAEPANEQENYISIVEKLDETSFFALITESLANTTTGNNELNDEELLSYLSSNISDYEIVLQTEN